MPVTVTARSKARIVFLRSDSAIVDSNPIQAMDVCVRLFSVCVILSLGSGLATGWSLAQGVLPSVKNDYGTEYEAWALNGLQEPLEKKIIIHYTTEDYQFASVPFQKKNLHYDFRSFKNHHAITYCVHVSLLWSV
jgi:hypothetical protein